MPTVALFPIPDGTHFGLALTVAAGLVEAGADVHVLAHPSQAGAVESVGAAFVDLFGRLSVDAADDASRPLPSRYVTHAGHWAEEIIALTSGLGPDIVVHDLYCVAGRLAAVALGIPRVALALGHDPRPAAAVDRVRREGRTATDPRCEAAVAVLRDRYGIEDASPLSYMEGLSELLNVVFEPPAFLTDAEREPLEPVAFYGSLRHRAFDQEPRPVRPGAHRRVVVAFGTIIWRYYTPEALDALSTIVEVLAERDDVHGIVSLGGAELPEEALDRLRRDNVEVHGWIDQQAELAGAAGFVTHHGMSSTHEAIRFGVPMLSFPFFVDQPALAARCRKLGLARPLVDELRAPPDADRVRHELDRLLRPDAERDAAFARALRWEQRVVADRPALCDRILRLARLD